MRWLMELLDRRKQGYVAIVYAAESRWDWRYHRCSLYTAKRLPDGLYASEQRVTVVPLNEFLESAVRQQPDLPRWIDADFREYRQHDAHPDQWMWRDRTL